MSLLLVGPTWGCIFLAVVPVVPLPHVSRGMGEANRALSTRAGIRGLRGSNAPGYHFFGRRYRVPGLTPGDARGNGAPSGRVTVREPARPLQWADRVQSRYVCGCVVTTVHEIDRGQNSL